MESTDSPNEQLLNIQPRLCTLHKWSHYEGYGIHLSRDKHPLGLRIESIEPDSPAESGGLLCGDIVLTVNGHSTDEDNFYVVLSCIQYALEQDQIQFLVIDSNSAELAQRDQIKIDVNGINCIRMESSKSIENSNNLSNDSWLETNSSDQTKIQDLSHDGSAGKNDVLFENPDNNNVKAELRMCSVVRQSSVESIGISLQPDEDFGHVIRQVEPNSPADRAGVKSEDYIISVNHFSLIYIPYEDALYRLKQNRHERKLDFLLAKKSYLLRSAQKHSVSKTNSKVFLSSDSIDKTRSFTLPTTHKFEKIYYKYKYEQSEGNYQRETVSTITDEHYDSLSLHLHNARQSIKHKKKHSKVLRGIGPAIVPRLSWSSRSEKTNDHRSSHSDLYDRISDIDETQKRHNLITAACNTFRVGMTNPSPTQQARRIPARIASPSFSDDGKRSTQSPASVRQYQHSPKVVSSPSSILKSNRFMNTPSPLLKHNKILQKIRNATPTTPIRSISARYFEKQDYFQASETNLHLATIPISDLSDHGYELLNIKLLQPTGSIPLGFKLSKQTDSFRCIVSGIEKQSKADIAGLKIDDWLIKIEDDDIRSVNFPDISKNIYRIINTVGSINLLIARKKFVKRGSVMVEQQISTPTTRDKSQETNPFLSVGLSNKIDDKNQNQSKTEENTIPLSDDSHKDNTSRHIILKEALGLDFYSFVPDQNNQNQIHSITNVRPLSIAYRAGLRNGDRILTVNDVDVTNTTHKTVRHRLLKKSPVHLTVINDPKYLQLIENVKRKQNRITISAAPDYKPEKDDQQQQPSNLLSDDLINVLFIDDKGPVYMKHCILKKEPSYSSMGFILRYINNCHIANDVETNMPAYNCGLRSGDIVLCVNKQNVERMKHEDVKTLIRTLAISNEIFNLIVLNNNDLQRYKTFQEKSFIDWINILSEIDAEDIKQIEARQRRSIIDNTSNKPTENSASALLPGARICILEPSTARTAGFSISGEDKAPFIISKIEKDSPASNAGLQLHDALLSIDGKSLLETTYEETIQIIKQALQHKIVQIVVNKSADAKRNLRRDSSESSMSYGSEDSDASDEEGTADGARKEEPCRRGANALQDYQKLRTKELSYAVRLCHLSATNSDGTPGSTFGFDVTKEAKYEYPMISQVEHKLPGERSGLQARDLILKVNGRKTKGVDVEKVRRAIEKAKHNGRLELLIIDEEVYRYGMRTNKKFKEPYIKVKHIFPRSRSSISFESLNSIAARASVTSQDIINQLKNGPEFTVHRLSIPSEIVFENDENLSSAVSEETIKFDSSSVASPLPSNIMSFTNKKMSQKQTSVDDSMIDSVLNTINNFFQNDGSSEPIKPHYDVPSEPIYNTKSHMYEQNSSKESQHVSRLYHKIRSNRSSGLYDYIRDPRRCVLKIDPNKGLGFVLSVTGDYDHTITAIEKNSAADIAGLKVDDEVVEIDHIDVRSIKYEQVVEMLFTAMQSHATIEICVINSHMNDFYPSTSETNKRSNIHTTKNLTTTTRVLNNTLSCTNSPVNNLRQQTINTSHPNLYDQTKHSNNTNTRNLSESVPALSTGITASPKDFRSIKSVTTSSKKDSNVKILNISKKEAPIARLCRIRKFPTSPFYGFFLSGDPKKLGRVHISNITKNSSAAICGLRNGDRIIEINGVNVSELTYETILNKIKLHMERHDLELLVLDKKSLRWYRERKYPITSRTFPTIVHIEPVLNNVNAAKQLSPKH